jgi:predicted DNA-binding protein (UPF0251 family)
MPRPKIRRCLRFRPSVCYFKPRGVPLRLLEEVVLAADELEAIKLHDLDRLDQKEAAEKMKISQPTFARILSKAQQKLAEALIRGKAVRLG